jgi:hypothetical protein
MEKDFEEETSIPPLMFSLVFESGILSKSLANGVIDQIKIKNSQKREYYKSLTEKSHEEILKELGF